MAGEDHAAARHLDAERHHHHTHAGSSQHPGGHHLLTVEHLSVSFRMYDPAASFFAARHVEQPVIRDLSISVHAGEIVAVVGASGSGKTLLADAILGLNEPNARVTGSIWFDGVRCDARGVERLRGHGISLVPQSVDHLAGREERARRRERARQLFAAYGLPEETMRSYPHELSGGMARRVLLMCALMDDPRVIVADEPTPGLDLELAAHALDDLRTFANAGGGVLLITHDIELALHVADRIAVFREGTVVEETAAANFASPDLLEHPFSRALWHAMPEHGFAAVGGSAGACAAQGGDAR